MRDDWFSRLTGFNEGPYSTTRELLEVNGSTLRSKVNDRSFCIGQFEMPSLADLRLRVAQGTGASGPNRVSIVTGDVRKMHQMPEYAGALFQVASQFNALEMVGPSVTPEDGVTRYEHDRTQGPACAIAAGAATIYRNYFAPVRDQTGPRAATQLDGLADLGAELSRALGRPVPDLWSMQNGYALATRTGLEMIGAHLRETGDAAVNELAGHLRVGVHQGVEAKEAVIRAAKTRLKPIFMTSITMVTGMLPTALALTPGSETRVSMAWVVIGGLLSSTFFTLVAIPLIFVHFEYSSFSLRALLVWFRGWRKTGKNQAPPDKEK